MTEDTTPGGRAYEPPSLTLRHGSGREATGDSRDRLRALRMLPGNVPSAEEIFAAYPQFAGSTCVFVSGSLTLGWGHAHSDLDLYVVSADGGAAASGPAGLLEDRAFAEDAVAPVALGEIGQFRADIELWGEGQVDELIRRFTPRPPPGRVTVRRGERDLLYRLTTGVAVTGHAWWDARRQAVLASGYGQWLARNRKVHAEGALEDASGLLISGDPDAAALAAREGYVAGLEMVLALHADFSSSHKWLLRRLLSASPAEVGAGEAREVLLMADCARDPAAWARRTVSAAQRLILMIEERL
ncbi:hypothetical protein [Streptomyces sp. NPDC021224]|uniref:hypothetical protein n=1 Tax=unclassified Streptomyces TaxID=2593676 RepID=UPI0037A08ABD